MAGVKSTVSSEYLVDFIVSDKACSLMFYKTSLKMNLMRIDD